MCHDAQNRKVENTFKNSDRKNIKYIQQLYLVKRENSIVLSTLYISIHTLQWSPELRNKYFIAMQYTTIFALKNDLFSISIGDQFCNRCKKKSSKKRRVKNVRVR
jgi:hypothetical protein